MENDASNRGEYINCYNEVPTGYYFDENDLIYKKCYSTCQTCDINGDNIYHNCTRCKNEFNFEIKSGEYKNCYEQCDYYYYFDNINHDYHCTTNDSCPDEYPKLVPDEKQCIIGNVKYIEDRFPNVIKDVRVDFEELKKYYM